MKPESKPRDYKRHDPFERALKEAKKKLEKSLLDMKKFQDNIAKLNAEIPRLKGIIASIEKTPDAPAQVSAFNAPRDLEFYLKQVEAAKDDLTGLGFIPSNKNPNELSEDELLPEPEGDPILE